MYSEMFMRLKRIQKLDSHRPLRRGRFIFCLSCSLALLGMIAPELPKNDPPHPPLQRGDARIYNIQIQVQNKLRTTGWPMLPHTNWSQLDVDSVGVSDATSKDIPFTAQETTADPKQWQLQIQQKDYTVHFRALAFSSELDNRVASSIPWPKEWEASVSEYVQPSKFIESGDSIFVDAVRENGDPRSVPVHIAAKVLIRYCLQNIESTGRYTHSKGSITTGIDVKGARRAVRNGKGSAADLVCVCVATLRAAGIPARPVVGITNADTVGTLPVDPHYMVWGEYALPGAGWVPFVPKRMRGTVDGLSTTQPWQGLGTLPWLNRRIPLAYNFNCGDIDRGTQNLQMIFISSPK